MDDSEIIRIDGQEHTLHEVRNALTIFNQFRDANSAMRTSFVAEFLISENRSYLINLRLASQAECDSISAEPQGSTSPASYIG